MLAKQTYSWLDAYREGQTPPSQHRHVGSLVQAETASNEVLVVCVVCLLYWRTDIRGENTKWTMKRWIAAADQLYLPIDPAAVEKPVRRRKSKVPTRPSEKRSRGRPRKYPLIEERPRFCLHCCQVLRRKTYPSGMVEYPSVFLQRQYCDVRCCAAHKKGKSLRAYRQFKRTKAQIELTPESTEVPVTPAERWAIKARRIADLYKSGLGIRRISKRLQINQGEVVRALEHCKVEMRPRYALPQDERDALVAEMYADYLSGLSCSQVGKKYGKSRQSIHEAFKSRKLPLRPIHAVEYPRVWFDGVSYTWSSKGYYRRTDGSREMLHHDVWRFHCGEVPNGYQIGHRDRDKSNNDLANLICLPIDEMTRFHHPQQPVIEGKCCEACGQVLRRRPAEGPSSFNRRKFCDWDCFQADHQKK